MKLLRFKRAGKYFDSVAYKFDMRAGWVSIYFFSQFRIETSGREKN